MARIFSATYDPYTYDQLSAPLKEATLYHQNIQEQYDNALLEAYKLNSMLDKERDKESWEAYNNVVNTIYQMTDYLNTNGLDPNAQANLMRVKMQNKDIYDINAAINRRQQTIDTFNKSANGQSPRYIGKRPEETSVDDWRGGRTPDMFGVNGEQVSKYVETTANTITSQLYHEYSSRGYRITEVGVDPRYRQQIFTALADDKYNGNYQFTNDATQNQYMNEVVKELKQAVKNAQYTFGFDQLDSEKNKQKFAAELFNGIQNGIQYGRKNEVDQYAMENVRFNHQLQQDYQNQLYDYYKDPTKPAFLPNGQPNPYYQTTGQTEQPYLATNSSPVQYNGKNIGLTQKYITGYKDKNGNDVQPILTKEKLDIYNAIKEREQKLQELGIPKNMLYYCRNDVPFDEFVNKINNFQYEQNTSSGHQMSIARNALQDAEKLSQIGLFYNQLQIIYERKGDDLLTDRQHDAFRNKMGKDLPENYTYEQVINWINNDPEWRIISSKAYDITSNAANPKHHELLFEKFNKYLSLENPEIYVTDQIGMKKESIKEEDKEKLISGINDGNIKPEDVEFMITPESSYQSDTSYMIVRKGKTRYLIPIAGLFGINLNNLGYFTLDPYHPELSPRAKLHKNWVNDEANVDMQNNMAEVCAIIRQILNSEIPQETTNAKSIAK